MDPNLGRLRGGFWLRRGVLRLVPGADGDRETFAISTSLQELLNHDEGIGPARPHGRSNALSGGSTTGNWFERRQRQLRFLDADPIVLIIGAGKYPNMIQS